MRVYHCILEVAPYNAEEGDEVDDKLTFDAREVQKLSGLALSTVFEKSRNGEIPGAIRVGRRLLFSRARILEWLDGRENDREGD